MGTVGAVFMVIGGLVLYWTWGRGAPTPPSAGGGGGGGGGGSW